MLLSLFWLNSLVFIEKDGIKRDFFLREEMLCKKGKEMI